MTVPGGFKIGKTYRHTTGKTMTIVGAARTFTYGYALIAEDDDGALSPVASDEWATVNYDEVPDMRDWSAG